MSSNAQWSRKRKDRKLNYLKYEVPEEKFLEYLGPLNLVESYSLPEEFDLEYRKLVNILAGIIKANLS